MDKKNDEWHYISLMTTHKLVRLKNNGHIFSALFLSFECSNMNFKHIISSYQRVSFFKRSKSKFCLFCDFIYYLLFVYIDIQHIKTEENEKKNS